MESNEYKSKEAEMFVLVTQTSQSVSIKQRTKGGIYSILQNHIIRNQ